VNLGHSVQIGPPFHRTPVPGFISPHGHAVGSWEWNLALYSQMGV